MTTTAPHHPALPHRPSLRGRSVVPGLAAVAVLTAVATGLGHLVPVVGGPVFAIVAGAAIASLRPVPAAWRPGITFGSRRVLQGSIVVLGTGLSVTQVVHTGERSLPVLIGSLVVALTAAWAIGRRLGLGKELNILVGVGTAICGASAIAATDSVLDADEADVSYAIATIFTFNVLAVLTFPTLGHALGLSPHAFGLWSGTAVNDTSSVVAASSIYGHGAASYAVVVKLTRTLAIIPICLAVGVWRARRPQAPGVPAGGFRWRKVVPLFILGFIAAVTANSLHLVPAGWHGHLSTAAATMITAALAAVGLSTRIGDIRAAGPRPLALGALLWVIVGVTSLAIGRAVGAI